MTFEPAEAYCAAVVCSLAGTYVCSLLWDALAELIDEG